MADMRDLWRTFASNDGGGDGDSGDDEDNQDNVDNVRYPCCDLDIVVDRIADADDDDNLLLNRRTS